MCHSSTRPGTSYHVTQFYQPFPCVNTASDKRWGEKAWVRGCGRGTFALSTHHSTMNIQWNALNHAVMNRSGPVVSVWNWGQFCAVNISKSHATCCNSVSAAPLQPTLIHERVHVGGTTQKDTQNGVSHLRECGVASTSLHCCGHVRL